MGWQEEDALDKDAERRLREVLGRRPTLREIKELRHGEQALGLEDPSLAKARQLGARARALRDLNAELLRELRGNRQKARRARLLAFKKRQHSA